MTWYVGGGSAVRIVARLRFSHYRTSLISSQGVECIYMFFWKFSKESRQIRISVEAFSVIVLWLNDGSLLVFELDSTAPPKQCSDVT